MRILIVGMGSIGRRHAENLLALGIDDLIAVHSGRGTLPAQLWPSLAVVPSLGEGLARGPNAVLITNPTAYHLEAAIPAAQAGCHLLLEKPLSNSRSGVGTLEHAVAVGGGKVIVGFQYRQHPGLRAIAQWLKDGAVGRVHLVRAHYGDYLPDWHPWEDYRQSYAARQDLGGGAILTLCHPIDYLQWFFGPATCLTAVGGPAEELEIDVEAVAEILLRFGDGAFASIHLNLFQRPSAHWLEILGSEGTIRWDQSDGAARLYRASGDVWQESEGRGFAREDCFRAEAAHLLDVVNGRAEPACDLQDGIAALETTLAAREMALSNWTQPSTVRRAP